MENNRIAKGLWWDRAWQLVDGCSKCSPGCFNCWSESLANRFDKCHDYNWQGRILLRYDNLDLPLRQRKPTAYAVWNDLFHPAVSDEFIGQALMKMFYCQKHTFFLLTKRAKRLQEYLNPEILPIHTGVNDTPYNVYFGLTVCNQKEADEKMPVFLQIDGKKFLSIEPLLEAVDLNRYFRRPITSNMNPNHEEGIDCDVIGREKKGEILQVIIGCESGPKRRVCKVEWIENIIGQCKEAGIPCFIKQINDGGKVIHDANKFPKTLQVRQLIWNIAGA